MPPESTGLDLKAFLAEQSQEGELDSQGAFTIASDKAMEKLSYFALPHESDWVLKVIQAANLWRVERVVVVQTRVATSFTFSPRPQPAQALLVQALSGTSLDNRNPLHNLAIALRSLVQQVGLSFVLAFRRDGEGEEPIFAGDDTTSLDARTRQQWAVLPEDGIRLTVSHFRGDEGFTGRYLPTFARVDRRDISILQTLQSRAFLSEVPIFLDGRRLTDPARSPTIGYRPAARLLRQGVLRPGANGSKPVFESRNFPWQGPASDFVLNQANPSDHPWYLLRAPDWRYLPSRLSDDLRSPHHLHAPPPRHSLVMLRQGVVCQIYRLHNSSLATTVMASVPADHYRSDLSGLALEVGEEELDALTALRGWIANSLRELPDQLADQIMADEEGQGLGCPIVEPPAAGFSIFTESLGKPVGRLISSLRRAGDHLRHHSLLPATRARLLAQWRMVMEDEVAHVAGDFEQRRLVEE